MKILFLITALLTSPDSFAVVNGKLAQDSKFAAIGSLKVGSVDSASCTATLISERWIVTAVHCIADEASEGEEESEPLLPADYEFRLGVEFHRPEFKSKLKRWVKGPILKGEQLDIAFGELISPVPLKKLKISPLTISKLPWKEEDLKSEYLHIGYGVQEAFSEENPLSNRRQIAKLTVTSTKGNSLLNLFGTQEKLEEYLNAYHPQSIDAGSLEAILYNAELVSGYSVHAWDARGREDRNNIKEPNDGWQDTCFGDSGGPLLREKDGKLSIIGVVSHGMDRICSPFGTKFVVFGPKVVDVVKSLSEPKPPKNIFQGISNFLKDLKKEKPKGIY